jgi:hypothetical protein
LGRQVLVASAGDDPRIVSTLKEHLRAALPAYMVPSAIVTLQALPLTPNGKINRAALPPPDGVRAAAAPRTRALSQTEAELVPIWARLLRLDAAALDVLANFFDLGGHSLLATQLTMQMRQVRCPHFSAPAAKPNQSAAILLARRR